MIVVETVQSTRRAIGLMRVFSSIRYAKGGMVGCSKGHDFAIMLVVDVVVVAAGRCVEIWICDRKCVLAGF